MVLIAKTKSFDACCAHVCWRPLSGAVSSLGVVLSTDACGSFFLSSSVALAIPRIVAQQLVWMEVVELYEASLAAVRWACERNLLVQVGLWWRWRSVSSATVTPNSSRFTMTHDIGWDTLIEHCVRIARSVRVRCTVGSVKRSTFFNVFVSCVYVTCSSMALCRHTQFGRACFEDGFVSVVAW